MSRNVTGGQERRSSTTGRLALVMTAYDDSL